MPKSKTNSAAKKRFTVTASGKVMRHQSGKRHNLSKRIKTTKQKRSLTRKVSVHIADRPRIKKLLNI